MALRPPPARCPATARWQTAAAISNHGPIQTKFAGGFLIDSPGRLQEDFGDSRSWLKMVDPLIPRHHHRTSPARDSFRSVEPLQSRTIHDYTSVRNQNPTPFAWTADLEDLLPKIVHARQALEMVTNQC